MSPDQNVSDLRAAGGFYRSRGIEVCWLIHPVQRWAEVWDAQNEGTRIPESGALVSDALPGFRLALSRLWAAIDPLPS